jgi:hypothetical protein
MSVLVAPSKFDTAFAYSKRLCCFGTMGSTLSSYSPPVLRGYYRKVCYQVNVDLPNNKRKILTYDNLESAKRVFLYYTDCMARCPKEYINVELVDASTGASMNLSE